MFAVYAAEPKPDDPLAALVVGERPAPQVPPGHVAVKVRAASLNMHDVWTLRGVGIRAEQFPMILGMDGAGVTDDGREVVIHSVIPSPGWRGDETLDPNRSMLTERYQGTFAETVVVPEANVLPKPASMSFSEAACMGTAWLTAYRMLFVKSGLRPGQTMLVQGASGGVNTALAAVIAAAYWRSRGAVQCSGWGAGGGNPGPSGPQQRVLRPSRQSWLKEWLCSISSCVEGSCLIPCRPWSRSRDRRAGGSKTS